MTAFLLTMHMDVLDSKIERPEAAASKVIVNGKAEIWLSLSPVECGKTVKVRGGGVGFFSFRACLPPPFPVFPHFGR